MKQTFGILTALFVLTGCSVSNVNQESNEHWKNYSEFSLVDVAERAKGKPMAVFYRDPSIQAEGVNIYINGDYQASLLKHGTSVSTLCQDGNLVTASVVTNQKTGNRTQGLKLNGKADDITYIKVAAIKNGEAQLQIIEPEQAEQELKSLATQSHTLPRVQLKQCGARVLEAFTLNSNVAFPVNKSSYNDVLPPGKKAVAEFAEKINAIDPKEIKNISVNGYTDPSGSDAYNQTLSEKRAQAIRTALLNEKVQSPIQAIGYGEQNLLITNCAAQYSNNHAARSQCDQPNRRVEIILYGH